MKRGSLVGPILLILIGVLVLLHNIRPECGAIEILSTYWPFVLVAWGGLRLLEILLLAARSRPLPRAGVTGGEWALVILICVVAGGVDAARDHLPLARLRVAGIEIFGNTYDFRTSISQPAGEATRLQVENRDGNVRIVGDETTEVSIERRTTVRALDETEAREAHDACPIEALIQGDQITVRTNHDLYQGPSTVSSDLEITVPLEFSVSVSGRSGDFDVANVTGDVDLESNRGDARLADIGGSGRLNIRRSNLIRILNLEGNLTLEGQGRNLDIERIEGLVEIQGGFSGEIAAQEIAQPWQFEDSRTEIRVEQIPGEIRIAGSEITASQIAGPIRLATRSQDVRLTDFSGQLDIEMQRGDLELRPGQPPLSAINVEIHSGNIDLALPAAGGSSLFVRTDSGSITNDYDPSLKLERNEREATLSGSDVDEPLLRLHTNRGDITIRKASETSPSDPELAVERL